MSARVANCPSCGGEITFRWSGAVQTTCSYCSSILVRKDVDLEKVGKVSEPPPITSRIRIGSQGSYRGRAFTVVGRIAYGWQRGGWSEWHVVFEDGRSGWISDAQADYAVTFLVPDPGPLLSAEDVKPGIPVRHGGTTFEVASVTSARYAGVEGELPFEYWDHEDVPFADLKSEDGRLATIDYSEDPPLLFVGEYVDFEALRLSGLREEEEKRTDEVATANCPNCGGAVTILHADKAVNVVCGSCGSVLDARTPELEVVQKASERMKRIEPLIPLGSKGKLRGHEYEVLGFQERTIRPGGIPYSWREYLLYNPRQGYRYLSEFDDHWNDIIPLKSVPKVKEGRRPVAVIHGETFKHFQHARAETTYVLGEFPWEVRVGDKVLADDYVSPPRMLSSEKTREERTWSLAEYTPPAKIWKAFGLEGPVPTPRGVFANQPSPTRGAGKTLSTFLVLAALLAALFVVRTILPNSRVVLAEPHAYAPSMGDSAAVVLGAFTLQGRTSNLEVDLDTNVDNTWVYFTISLLNMATGETVDFGREVGYYHGRDSEGSWSEGSREESPRIPSVPPGEYMLRVVPEGPSVVSYRVTLRRDVPQGIHFLLALGIIAVPAMWSGLRHGSFEMKRWQESDYAVETD